MDLYTYKREQAERDASLQFSYVTEYSKLLASYVTSIVVKREDLANRYETLESAQQFDYYSMVISGTDTYETYESYSEEMMIAAGLTAEEIRLASINKMSVPLDKQAVLLQLKRQETIDNYVESNRYYRMLMGLPSLDDYLKIYMTEQVPGVDISRPIDEMTDDEISVLRSLGYIDTFIERYPNRPYLKYLGNLRIDFMTARAAKRFEMIRTGELDNPKLKERFNINYELSRAYILNNYYRKRLSVDQAYFDAYIGFIMVVNALIMTTNDSLDVYNAKEYYNEFIVKEILQSHKLDIFDDIPLIYRKEVANNIKSLIVSKGTDEVIFKIFKLFGLNDVTIKKFMLVRNHQKDENGDFIFKYDPDTGEPVWDEMYDISFASIDINTQNIDAEIRKGENKIGYFTVANADKYWGGYETAEEVRQKLLRENFNYIDTDYISINTAYSLTEIVTEISYFFSMLFSLKGYMKKLTMIEPIYGYTVDVFYVMTMIAALISKRSGLAGDIITNPIDLAYLYKYNFERNLNDITEILNRYHYTSHAPSYMIPILNSEVSDPQTLVNLYFNDKAVLTKLSEIKSRTKDFKEYAAIKDIFDYLMKSKLSSDVFKKRNGMVATTYIDFLKDGNSTLGSYVDDLPFEDIDNTIFRLLTSLEDYFNTERFQYLFLKIPNLIGENSIKRYMLKVINTFKAFTINIFAMTVSYDIDDKDNGNIKILDVAPYDGFSMRSNNVNLVDTVSLANTERVVRTNVKINDEIILIS